MKSLVSTMKKNKEKYKPFTQCIPQPKPELADKELLSAMDTQDSFFRYTREQLNEAFRKVFNTPIQISKIAVVDYDNWKEFYLETPLTAPINPLTTIKINGSKKFK